MRTEARRAPPHLLRAALAGAIGLGGSILASIMRGDVALARFLRTGHPRGGTVTEILLFFAGVAILVVAATIAVRAVAKAVATAAEPHVVDNRRLPLARTVSVVGYVVVLLWVLGVAGIGIEALLLGGALSGVVLGIAAQQTLGNFFAGIVLMFARPFRIGEDVVIRAGMLGGEYEGVITDMTAFYVRMQTRYGPVLLPNSGVLAAAVGPGARTPKEEEAEDEEEEQAPPPIAGGPPEGRAR